MATTAGKAEGFGRAAPRWRAALLLCTALGLAAPPAAPAEITLRVQPNRTQIYAGESFLLNVVVDGADEGLDAPDVSALQAETRLLGSQSQSQHFIQNINGRVTRSDTQARLFAFQVRPLTSGVFATGPVTLTHRRKRYTGQGPDVQVTGQEQQDLVVAHVTSSREAVLVDEPFTITLAVAVAALPPPNEKFEAIHPNNAPRLECEFLQKAEIPGLQTPDLQAILSGLVTRDPRRGSFAINDLQSDMPDPFSDPFGDFNPFRPRPLHFLLPHTRVVRNGREYDEYTLALTYTPKQEGDYTFGPLAFKGPVIVGADPRGQAVFRQISCIGPAVTVRVVPPPETNRPDCFIGSVGSNLAVHAELDASVCKVGDPLTLSLDVTGAISLGNMRPPLLNLQPALTAEFRIYDDNVESTTIPSGKRFRYRIRPVREGTLELPPIQVAWFDTATRTYRTAASQPIPVQARANTQLVSDSGTNGTRQVTRLAVERTSSTPAAITVNEAGARAERLLPSLRSLLSLLAAGPLALLLAWGAQSLYRHRASLLAALRRRRALSQALTALRAAGRAGTPDPAAVGHVVRGFLAARLGVPGRALTAAEAGSLLQSRGVSARSAQACGTLLTQLDQALYRPDAPASETADVVREARTLLPRLAAELDRPPASKEGAE